MPGHAAPAVQPLRCYNFSMMTRAQVARRLGKSIATVRRMEGVEIHPRVDDRGINRFDPADVERVAAGELGVGARRRARPVTSDFDERAVAAPDYGDCEHDLERARRDAREAELAFAGQVQRVSTHETTIARLERENRDLRAAFRTCASMLVGALGPSQLAELGEEGLEALQEMIELCG